MVYADYSYYTAIYLGTVIDADDFPRMAVRASAFLDYCTQGRAKDCPDLDALKMACCALAEDYQTIEQAKAVSNKGLASAAASDSGELQSQSVGGWSKTYRSAGDSAASAIKAGESVRSQLYETARQYLGMTGLLRARGYYA